MEMLIPQLVFVALVIGAVVFFTMRAKGKAKAMGSVQPGLDLVRAGFAASRTPDESEPVCVVAFHYAMMSATQVTVGVTSKRILVVKGEGPMQAFAYDAEGEHLPSKQKSEQKRGFFRWSHGSFNDGSKGYSPTVNHHPPFTGEEWRMYPTIAGFPEQTANLKEFSRLFYFQWFY